MKKYVVIHVDFDYFYAQCEEIRKPELRTVPVAVCVFSERGENSGAIATANYLARDYGVKAGMPITTAKRKLESIPESIFLPTDFDYYSDISQKTMDIMNNFADVFEYVGKDEAYLDITSKTGGSFDRAAHVGQQIKNTIRDSTKLTCSVGISPNKLVSKIASDFKKPDGLTIVRPENIPTFLEPLKIRDIPGIGKKTEDKLTSMGFNTVGQLCHADVFMLHKEFGRKNGTYIYNASRGKDSSLVAEKEPSVQYSKISTLSRDSSDESFLMSNLSKICDQLHEIVKKNNKLFRSVGIQFVQNDMSNKSHSRMLLHPTASHQDLARTAKQLLHKSLQTQNKPIRRLGVKVSDLSDMSGQLNIDSYF
ncbi:MAG: DNA polymerase IV [Cenarchaeum symbiont of Oopsacas minuta]|nr:DNA polymerase IV [Cenarchaeum symbiont of Oopsacas minuta]